MKITDEKITSAIAAWARAHHRAPGEPPSPGPLSAETMIERGLAAGAAQRAVRQIEPIALAVVGETIDAAHGARGPWPGTVADLIAAGVAEDLAELVNARAAEVWSEATKLYQGELDRIDASRPRGLAGIVARVIG